MENENVDNDYDDEIIIDTIDSLIQESGINPNILIYKDAYEKGIRKEALKRLCDVKDILLKKFETDNIVELNFDSAVRKPVCELMIQELKKIFPCVTYTYLSMYTTIITVHLFDE